METVLVKPTLADGTTEPFKAIIPCIGAKQWLQSLSPRFWSTWPHIFICSSVPLCMKWRGIWCCLVKSKQTDHLIFVVQWFDIVYLQCRGYLWGIYDMCRLFPNFWLRHVEGCYSTNDLLGILCEPSWGVDYAFPWLNLSEYKFLYSAANAIHWTLSMMSFVIIPYQLIRWIEMCHEWENKSRSELSSASITEKSGLGDFVADGHISLEDDPIFSVHRRKKQCVSGQLTRSLLWYDLYAGLLHLAISNSSML